MKTTAETRLTELVTSGGCAAKYPAGRLEQLLRGFVPAEAEQLLVGLSPADDAAVYRLDDERALVFTVDFFPPLVDDPSDFGAIAAANALNDVFAMGGRPLLALSIAAFPEELELSVVSAVLAAADERVRAAGALLAGGHTLREEEPKYGLAVVGTVPPDAVWTMAGARPGDVVFLTKPLGTGIVLQGAREGRAEIRHVEGAVQSMRALNDRAADLLRPFAPTAVTDVTGFGLFGHAHELAERSGVSVVLELERLPLLDGALTLAGAGVRTGGDRRNRDFCARRVELADAPAERVALGFDPQTSGGLLATIPRERAAVLEAEGVRAGVSVTQIGRIEKGAGVHAT